MPTQVYRAFDKTIFDTEAECIAYETALKAQLKSSIIEKTLEEHVIITDWKNEESEAYVAPLFAYLNDPQYSMYADMFLEAFIEGLDKSNRIKVFNLLKTTYSLS